MRRLFVWCLLTEKRLMKKISYVAMLLVMPILVLGLRQGAREEAGMVTIGLYAPAEEGSLSRELIRQFMEEKSVLRYLHYETEEEALRALEARKVDAVWIFPEHLERELERLAEKKRIQPVARVVEREDDVALVFTREVLCSRIFPEFVYRVYQSYVKEHMGENVLTEEEFRAHYLKTLWQGNLFKAQFLDGKEETMDNYVLAPVRGLLAIWLVISGLAGILYHKMDELQGTYDGIPGRKRLRYSFGLQTVVLINGGLIYLIACRILGVFTSLGRELLLLALFLLYIACFCNLLGLLIKRLEGIGVLIPVLTLLMMAFCPIFLNVRKFWMVQAILPPYLYLKAMHGEGYVLPMVLYAVCGIALCGVGNWIRRPEIK